MKTKTVLKALLTLSLLSACDAKRDLGTTKKSTDNGDNTPPVAAIKTPDVKLPDPEVIPPTTVFYDFCVHQELRDIYLAPTPIAASAMYVALVHDGVAGRLADPKCLTQYSVTDLSDGSTYIPCAVNNAEGSLYGKLWQEADRDWITGALTQEANLQNLLNTEDVSVTSEEITNASRFYQFPTLQGKYTVVLKLKSNVTFTGYCEQ